MTNRSNYRRRLKRIVTDFAVTSSSGYPDLDQSVEEMMRGATLPPFPAGISQPQMQVSVAIRFSLRR